jgi:ubiquinone/menaquinone biosynthesis C-methylase UbiE
MSGSDYWEDAYESGEYEHWEFSYPSPELTTLVAANFFPKNASALEIGSGGGNDAIFLSMSGLKVTAVDISLTALKIARKRGKKAHMAVNWLRGDVLLLPLMGESMDFISDRGLFHLIEDCDREAYASEVFRVLKTGGYAMIRGKSEESSYEQFNPITKEAIDKYFISSKFNRGPVLQIPLFSVEGSMDARIAILQKRS